MGVSPDYTRRDCLSTNNSVHTLKAMANGSAAVSCAGSSLPRLKLCQKYPSLTWYVRFDQPYVYS